MPTDRHAVICLCCEVVIRFGKEPASHGLCGSCFDKKQLAGQGSDESQGDEDE
jgi:hypothetical protein